MKRKPHRTAQYQPGYFDAEAEKKRKLDKLFHKFVTTSMSVDEYADRANAIDPPLLWDATKRAKVMKGEQNV